jgi:hypothetical protein
MDRGYTLPVCVGTLASGKQARLRLGDQVVLIDHRDDAWIALIEFDIAYEPDLASAAALMHSPDNAEGQERADGALRLQWLIVNGHNYLATWQRHPFDGDALKRFITAAREYVCHAPL